MFIKLKNFLMLFFIFSLFFPLTSSAGTNPSIFKGDWSGTGSYELKGTKTFCPEFEMQFDGNRYLMNFMGGFRNCEAHQEKFASVAMAFDKGNIFYNGQVVGTLKGNVLNVQFSMPEGNGNVRHWKMKMMIQDDSLIYEESRTMNNETTPLIYFLGEMKRKVSFLQLPVRPTEPNHPGNSTYEYQVKKELIKINGQTTEVFLPLEIANQSKKAPLIVFGHGQAIGSDGYAMTFDHLVKKGYAVVHPGYDKGFFDQDWRRMASDYNQATMTAIQQFSNYIDSENIVYSGHSKGAYVALVAAGSPSLQQMKINLGSLVLFAPAGFDQEFLKNMNREIPLSLIWGDSDTIIKKDLMNTIYQNSPARQKQLITVVSYPTLKADHFFPLSKSTLVGGKNGISAFHFQGSWKWLIGAAQDLSSNTQGTNTYLYGSESLSTGVEGLNHTAIRSW